MDSFPSHTLPPNAVEIDPTLPLNPAEIRPTLPPNMVRIQEAHKITKLHYVQVEVNEVILNYGARCFVVVYDENRSVVDRHFVEITGADYDRWIADNDIIHLVLEKMGFQQFEPASEPASEPAPSES